MAEKKRKGADSSAAQPSKKSKKSVKTAAEPVIVAVTEDVVMAVEPAPVAETAAKLSKKTRKRAADFLQDAPEEDSPKPKKGKKDANPQNEESKSLTADGTNGVVEHSDDEGVTITTSKQSKKTSMMAEAAQTQDAELAEEYGNGDDSADEEVDTAPALLTGFDSDNDDPAEDQNFDVTRTQPIPQFKKTSKKLLKAKQTKSDGPGVVYIGRVPHGFYESQMREYFAQFGTITRLRLSRNKKTGASKHFAFVEFESDEVAKIVADTMDNYLMFGHILKCKYAPAENLHADVWKGANKKYRKIPQHKLLKEKAEQPKTEEQVEKKMKKEQIKRDKKSKQMAELGYSYDLPTLVKPEVVVDAVEENTEKPLAIEDKVEGALVPPPDVPKDELAIKVEEKKKAKKGKKQAAGETMSATTPSTTEEVTAPVVEEPKKTTKKGKKEVVVIAETTPAIAAEIAALVEEPTAKRTRKGKKDAAVEVAPVVVQEVVVEAAKPAKKGKKGKKDDIVVESTPVVITEETVVVTEDPAPKKGKKGKKEAVVETAPVVIEEVAAVVEDAPKKGKKSKKDTEVVSEPKVDKKQLKGILKKTKKA